ncbi:MAG: M20/M25/M40 family metallo-hydrolase [Patescibacteria group bacterium]
MESVPKHEILALTQQLISFQSVKENTQELRKIVDFAANYFKNTNLTIKKFCHHQKPALIITFKNTKKPQLFLNGHLDVVEAESELFKSKVRGDKLFGRGAADMKGSVAVMMVLLKNLARTGKKPNIGLMLTTDEEIGGFDGAGYLLDKKGYSCNVAFVPDGGKDFNLIIEEKGIIHFKLKTQGKSCHASRPWLGDSAIDKLVKALSILRKSFINPKSLDDWKISFNIGTIEGGDAANKVADWACAYCDIRYPKRYNYQTIIDKIIKLTGIKPEIMIQGDVFSTSAKNNYLKLYQEIAEKILQKKLKYERHPAGSDARFFSARNIPVILTEPITHNAHAKNEWLSITSLEMMYSILQQYIEAITRIPKKGK